MLNPIDHDHHCHPCPCDVVLPYTSHIDVHALPDIVVLWVGGEEEKSREVTKVTELKTLKINVAYSRQFKKYCAFLQI